MHTTETHHLEVTRTARVLTRGPRDAREVWFLLHGYGCLAKQQIDDCAALASPERLLVAPEALSRFYPRGSNGPSGASWMTREDRQHEIADYVAYLDRVASFVGVTPSSPPRRAFVLGFSQGAPAAWRWAALGTTPLQRLVAWAGDIPPELALAAPHGRLARLALTLVRGDRDALYDVGRLDADCRRLADSGLAFEALTFGGGHHLDAALLARLADRGAA